MPRILIADDQADVLAALRLLLKGDRFEIETAASPAGVIKAVDSQELDVVLIDLNYARDTTSGSEGLDLLTRIQAIDPTLPVVVMTAWGSVDLAVEAMRRGARDFIQKPWDNARLLAIIRTQIELSQALRKGQRLEAENSLLRGDGVPKLIAESSAMQNVLQVIARVGPSDANVLLSQQAKLLRVIETGEFERLGSSRTRRVDVRIISATNANLPEEVAGGRFRQDLLFRLNTIEIRLPPLRDRREDIPLIAQHFLRQHAQRYRKRLTGFESGAMQMLLEHSWPGNIRELDPAGERAVPMPPGPRTNPVDLGPRGTRAGGA